MRRHNDRDMKYKYAKEKLGRVVRYLAIGERDVRDRLRVVSSDIFRLNGDDLPPRLRKHLVWIQRELTKYGPEVGPNGERYKNAVSHTLGRIRNSTGRKIAERILKMFSDVK